MSLLEHALLAVIAFVPQLLTQPGVIDSDTKTYLYQDPGRFTSGSVSMWDPTTGLGTVTHEQIGYLFPMGPFYGLTRALGLPVWVSERLWVGLILFGAGAGVLYLARTIGLRGPGRTLAALAFMLSPYTLQYLGRISVILLPWAGLPWLVALTARAVRRGGWRYPALFAVVVLVISGINASSLLYVGIAPALWLPYAVMVAKEHTWREALGATWRICLLSFGVSLWWIVGLQIEGADGVNVLKYTETVHDVSSTSSSAEVLRGLGYWYFYGSDSIGQWVSTSLEYTQQLWVVALSFLVPALAVLGAVMVRWRHRAYFVLITLVGMLFAVGAHPFDSPSPVGVLLKRFFTTTTAGLAMRSTDRASPLVVLGLAMLLGSGASALYRHLPQVGALAAVFGAAVVMAANPPIWNGTTIANQFTRPTSLPAYLQQAADAMNASQPGTRVFAIPGEDFGQYRWGDTVDPVWPGLLDDSRPFVTREQLILGSLASADVLYAIDEPMQDGTTNPAALAPMARLISAGDVLVQNDLGYERYNQPQPELLWSALTPTPAGLGAPQGFGAPVPNVAMFPTTNEATLGSSADMAVPSPVEVFPVDGTRPITRAESAATPVVVDGDATGIADAASVGLLAGNPTILYAGTLDTNPSLDTEALAPGSTLVVTDTNRKQAYRWNNLIGNAGQTLTAAQPQPPEATNAPLDLFPNAPADSQSTAVQVGVAAVDASSYGNPITYIPENRAVMGIDGNPDTAWTTGAYDVPEGQWWQVQLTAPVTTDRVMLTQPTAGDPTRWITKATLTFDGRHSTTVDLGPASRPQIGDTGQTITFPTRTFRTLRITIDDTNLGNRQTDKGTGSVGFTQVGIPSATAGGDAQAQELIAMPSDLLGHAGASSQADRLTYVMTRERVAPTPPRSDPEPSLERVFTLPTTRTFSLSGNASIDALIPDDAVDRTVGRPGSTGSGVVAYSSGRLPGDLEAGAAAALDGNPHTIWQQGLGAAHQAGSWIQVELPQPTTFDHLDLQVVADGHHSVPTSVTVLSENGSRTVALPPIADGRRQDATVSVPVSFAALSGQHLRVTFDTARLEDTVNYYTHQPIALPLGIAELGIPGVQVPAVPPQLPGRCRSDLLSIDGRPISVEMVGSTSTALAGQPVGLEGCGPDAGGITLGPGTHVLQSIPGDTACGALTSPCAQWNLDQLVLDSAPGGAAEPDGPTAVAAPPSVPAPAVHVVSQNADGEHLQVSGITSSSAPFWLVLGQSVNAGWQLGADHGPSLGGSTLVDGFANGWRVDPAALAGAIHDGHLDLSLTWVPQQHEAEALVVSVLSVVVCLALVFVPTEARRRLRLSLRGRTRPETQRTRPVEDPDSVPMLASPFTIGGARPSWPRLALIAGAAAATVTLLTSPTVGLAVGLAVFTTLAVAHGRFILTVGAVTLIVATGTFVVIHQAMTHELAGSAWPNQGELAHVLTWMAMAFLGADAVIEIGRRARPTQYIRAAWAAAAHSGSGLAARRRDLVRVLPFVHSTPRPPKEPPAPPQAGEPGTDGHRKGRPEWIPQGLEEGLDELLKGRRRRGGPGR